jgi:hypothetical protein
MNANECMNKLIKSYSDIPRGLLDTMIMYYISQALASIIWACMIPACEFLIFNMLFNGKILTEYNLTLQIFIGSCLPGECYEKDDDHNIFIYQNNW